MLLPSVQIAGLEGIPMIGEGDDLAAYICAALERAAFPSDPRDVLVVAQKIVSKAEGRTLDLATVTPSPRAQELAEATGKDARFVEAVLRESVEVVRYRTGVIVVETRQGIVMANAGIDRSNVEGDRVLLLPEDPDRSAKSLRDAIIRHCGSAPAIVISDSVGRAWRNGTVGLAIGAAGLPALLDKRGTRDLYGRGLEITMIGFADAIASAASLVMGEGAESCPVALVSGLDWPEGQTLPASALIRPKHEDLFR